MTLSDLDKEESMKQKTCCILCDYEAEFESINPLGKNFRYDCPNCGTYYVDKA